MLAGQEASRRNDTSLGLAAPKKTSPVGLGWSPWLQDVRLAVAIRGSWLLSLRVAIGLTSLLAEAWVARMRRRGIGNSPRRISLRVASWRHTGFRLVLAGYDSVLCVLCEVGMHPRERTLSNSLEKCKSGSFPNSSACIDTK